MKDGIIQKVTVNYRSLYYHSEIFMGLGGMGEKKDHIPDHLDPKVDSRISAIVFKGLNH